MSEGKREGQRRVKSTCSPSPFLEGPEGPKGPEGLDCLERLERLESAFKGAFRTTFQYRFINWLWTRNLQRGVRISMSAGQSSSPKSNTFPTIPKIPSPTSSASSTRLSELELELELELECEQCEEDELELKELDE